MIYNDAQFVLNLIGVIHKQHLHHEGVFIKSQFYSKGDYYIFCKGSFFIPIWLGINSFKCFQHTLFIFKCLGGYFGHFQLFFAKSSKNRIQEANNERLNFSQFQFKNSFYGLKILSVQGFMAPCFSGLPPRLSFFIFKGLYLTSMEEFDF